MKKNKEIKLKISEQMFELISKSRDTNGARIGFGLAPSQEQFLNGVISVSYTHLTLPTILLV